LRDDVCSPVLAVLLVGELDHVAKDGVLFGRSGYMYISNKKGEDGDLHSCLCRFLPSFS
jgi:hypothetical protein